MPILTRSMFGITGMNVVKVRADMTVTHLLTLKVGESFEFGGAKFVSISDNLVRL